VSRRIAVIDPGSGNLASLQRAIERAARDLPIEVTLDVTTCSEVVAAADAIVLPGQGAFAACRRGLDALPGVLPVLTEKVRQRGTPFLGICVGMQLLAERGLEFGETPGLGWFRGAIAPLAAEGLPLPQMGWNRLAPRRSGHPLLAGIRPQAHVYFVHSFALSGGTADAILATTDYGGEVVAMVADGNVAGTQFHVEKSGPVGLRMLANFLQWRP
jgi:glutamine amidotransferase